MAAARVGYMLANEDVTKMINKTFMPYHMNTLSLAAADIVYQMRDEFIPRLQMTIAERKRMFERLETLRGVHPIVGKILDYRTLAKLKSTYLDGIKILINPKTRRVHTNFNQTVTATGRLSSSDPNLQNIPVRTDEGREIRALFEPGDGYDFLVSADYSQIELRLLAHMSGDENLISAFLSGQDIHARTAAEVFGVSIDNITPDLRRKAKDRKSVV